MKLFLRLFSILLSCAVLMTACREDEDRFLPYDDTEITTGITGLVADENGQAVPDAEVLYQDQVTKTDAHGVFTFSKVLVKSQGYIRVNKAGYFQGSRTIFPRLGQRQFLRIHLLQKEFSGTFNGAQGGSVTVDGISLEFPANAIIDGAGNSYAGTVKTAVKFLDPSLAETGFEMPGALVGLSEGGEMQSMVSYSMIAVELQGDAGQKLNLGNGLKAKVSFPIPVPLQASAPASIPLWSFNESTGYWEEEGRAERIGNNYVGNVSHFSFWNCDAPFPLIHLSGQALDSEGNPLSQLTVRIRTLSSGMTGYGVTNESGIFEGKVPKDEVLVLEFLDQCNDIVYTQNIGPFAADVILPPVQLTISDNLVHLTGVVVDCNDAPIDSAYVLINSGGYDRLAFTDATGAFDVTFISCAPNDEIRIRAIDLENLLESDEITVNGNGDIDLGQIQVCSNPLSEFIRFQIDGGPEHVIIDCYYFDSLSTSEYFRLSGGGQGADPDLVYEFGLTGSGLRVVGLPASISDLYIYIGNKGGGTADSYVGETLPGNLNWTAVASAPGEYYKGNFTMPNVFGPGGAHTVTGSFSIRRDQ